MSIERKETMEILNGMFNSLEKEHLKRDAMRLLNWYERLIINSNIKIINNGVSLIIEKETYMYKISFKVTKLVFFEFIESL